MANIIVVNGPIRDEIRMNHDTNVIKPPESKYLTGGGIQTTWFVTDFMLGPGTCIDAGSEIFYSG